MEDIQYNKEEVVIIGAGGLGRELVSWMFLDDEFQKNYRLVGFLDDNLAALNEFEFNIDIIGKVSYEELNKFTHTIIALADINYKKNITENILLKSNVHLASYNYKNVLIGLHTKIGNGVVLSPSVLISCNVIINDGVFINIGSQIGHDVFIGKYVSIMANVDIGGGAIIEDEVFIGSGSVILPGVKITKGTRIGAGSVVIKNIKKVGTYFGNPAKRVF